MEIRTHTRRDLFKIAGGAILGAIVSESCDDSNQPPTPSRLETSPLAEQATDASKLIVQEIAALPDSPIKKLLTDRISPYFSTSAPFISNREGFPLPVHKTSATLKYGNKSNVSGTYSGRAGSPPPEHKLMSPIKLSVPLVGIVTKNETAGFQRKAPDGTPVADIDFTTTEAVYEGIAPEITIERPLAQISQSNQRFFDATTRATMIKEASSFLIENILMEQMYLKMHQMGIETTYAAKSTVDNSTHQIEIIPQIVSKISSRKGRWVNGIDATGIIIALKALGDSELEILRSDKTFRPIIDNLASVNLGTSAAEVMKNAFEWYVNYPDVTSLPIVGNRNLIP